MSILVLDIGRTNVSVCLVSEDGKLLEHTKIDNKTRTLQGIEVFDTDRIWNWFLQVLKKTCTSYQPKAIITTTHAASVALLGVESQNEHRRLLDVLDYESQQYACTTDAYEKLRGDYALTGSPSLPKGLNLGRQLFWIQNAKPEIFSKCEWIIPYPQYWSYLLSGIASSEASSLGAHTDCWNPYKCSYSTLVKTQGWQSLFPPIRNAWDTLGPPRREVCEYTGLSPACGILCGIHDSNAAFTYHYRSDRTTTLLSTGTWVIGMCATSITPSEELDQLLNINLLGEILPSFRFMGGREWESLTKGIEGTPSTELLDELINKRIMALPAFTDQGGPFRNRPGTIEGTCPTPLHKKALASLYCAQVSAWCLDNFSVTGQVIIDGPFVNDEIYIAVLARLLPKCEILTSTTTHGTALGAARLAIWPKSFNPEYRRVLGGKGQILSNLDAYHQAWCKKVLT